MTIRHLDRLLTPQSVAVIGASARAGSVGATVWRNLRAGSFGGAVHAVNLKQPLLDGQRAVARVSDLPGPPDLAVVCTPPDTVPGLIGELGAFGTRAVVVLSAGLSAAQKQACLDAARPHVLRLLGPNCLGLMTPRLGLNASFSHAAALPGELAFVSQSGALVTAMIDWANARGIGFSQIVSLGERVDVDFGDLLDHLASDPSTRAILLYIESIEAPKKFMSAARAAARNKPVIVVKAGRSEDGRRAVASHTGALAGADVVFDAAIRRAGMLRVDTLDELFIAAQTLARFRANDSNELTVMTNGGGGGVLAADAAARLGVRLHQPDDALLQRLDAVLPANWSRGNPVDLIGDAPVERYLATLQALLDDRRTGAVLFMHAPTAIVPSAEIARACAPLAAGARDRVLSCWLGDAAVAQARSVFAQADVADYATPEEAVRAFALLRTYRDNQRQLMEAPAVQAPGPQPDAVGARALLDAALAQGRQWLDATEVNALLRAYHIPTVAMRTAPPDAEAAVAAARAIGYPVALKLMSPDITHKTEVGGVRLQLRGDADVASAAREMLARVAAERPQARVDGLLVQQMVERPQAEELIVGSSIDAVFGPVVLFGHGGIAVEVLGDRAVGLPPLNRVLARELIARTSVARLLAGFRNRPPARIDAVIDVLVAVSCLLADLPQIAELDINPLLADAQGVVALDARVRVSPQRAGGAAHFAIRPYPQELVEAVSWHGETLTLRPIRPEDEGQHLRFIEQLSPEDIRMRVFAPRRELPRSELARLTQIDYAREMAFLAERSGPDGQPETIGTVRAVSDPDGIEAEFAIVVRSDLKGRGLGRLLLDKLERYARAQGLQRITGVVLRENEAMLGLAQHVGFVIDGSKAREPGVVPLVRELQPA
ncbi:MAG: bifunctional acetate--CoA ligase family protein/GNAT family N-acetyltransferase [Burkholderiaceae bacterium]|nr:bifunctional acetate--CoA ligase family protein/GNAT family N-acetyltransferase [Burkholderiaceae bacterium]